MTTLNPMAKQIIVVTDGLLAQLGVAGTVSVAEDPLGLTASITSPDSALLIGWRGATLAAFENVVRLLLARELEKTGEVLPEIHVDIEGYKQRQMDELVTLAKETAVQVRDKREPEILRPMNAFERRIVHVALADATDVVTESIGVDPNRRIMIKPRV